MELDDTQTLEMDSQPATPLLIDTDVHCPLENTSIKQEPDFHTIGDGAKLSENSKYDFDVDVVDIKTERIDNDSYQNVDTQYTAGNCSNSNYVDMGILHDAHVVHVKSEPVGEPLETTDHNAFVIEIDTCKDEYYETRGYPNSRDNASLEDNQQRGAGEDCGRKEDIEHGDPQLGQGASYTSVDKNPHTAALSGIRCIHPIGVSQSSVQVPDIEPPIQLHGQSTKYVNPFQQSKHKPYTCSVCGVGFVNKRNIKIHMLIHTGGKPHKCSVCEVSFTQIGHLTCHMRTHTGEKPYKCSVCGVGFAQKGNMDIHLMRHTCKKPHRCDTCGVSFTEKGGLTRHMRIHTGDKPHKCSVCGVGFTQKEHMNIHTTTHTAKKPHTCSLCELTFTQKANLTRHTRTHTGEKPYKCSVCGAAFARKHDLKKHTRIHTGEKPHTCSVCGVSFAWKGHLTRHMRTHTGEKPYKCPVCGIRLGHANTLKKHMARHDRSHIHE